MTQEPNNKSRPFSLRLTPQERADLELRAGSLALGEYIRECIFGVGRHKTSRHQFPTKDRQALAKALALMGQSQFASGILELADAARIGALPVTEETEQQLRSACADIVAIKSFIMSALDIRED